MNSKIWLATVALAVGTAMSGASANAASPAPLSLLKVASAQSSNVVEAHFWHRKCRRGLNGWHKHVKGIGRVQCTNHVCKHGKCYWF
jgi:hypothetical protein